MIELVAVGSLVTVQDLGRPGHLAWGLSRSGAADRGSLRLANRLLGNAEGDAALELTMGGVRLRCDEPLLVALTGAPCELRVDGVPHPPNAPVHLAAGAELRVGTPSAGLRSYLAVRGGLDVPLTLGSASRDLLSEVGPSTLAPGDRLAVRRPRGPLPGVDLAPVPPPPGPDEPATLRFADGPRAGWCLDTRRGLSRTAYLVSSDSNRVAVRLVGRPLRRVRHEELPPEGLLPGAVQVPPDGQPIVFLADAPATGGYPVVAVLEEAEVDKAAQLRPGQQVRLLPAGPHGAVGSS